MSEIELQSISTTMGTSRSNSNYSKKIQCLTCRKFYLEEENTSTSCRSHCGIYREVFTMNIVSGAFIKKWSCCRSDSPNGEGCVVGKHIEDQKTSSILSQFDQTAYPTETPTENVPTGATLTNSTSTLSSSGKRSNSSGLSLKFSPTNQLGDGVEFENDQYKQMKDGTIYFKYSILHTDTLVGVALKFKLKLETLKSINSIQNDAEIYSRLFLYIPWEKETPFMDQTENLKSQEVTRRKHLVSKFMRVHNIPESEAHCYLSENNFDVEKAALALKEDLDWENTQPVRYVNRWKEMKSC